MSKETKMPDEISEQFRHELSLKIADNIVGKPDMSAREKADTWDSYINKFLDAYVTATRIIQIEYPGFRDCAEKRFMLHSE